MTTRRAHPLFEALQAMFGKDPPEFTKNVDSVWQIKTKDFVVLEAWMQEELERCKLPCWIDALSLYEAIHAAIAEAMTNGSLWKLPDGTYGTDQP